MKFIRYFLLCIVFVSSTAAVSKTESNTTSNTKEKTVSWDVGSQIILHSKILNEDRNILIRLPENYTESKKRYPVIYLLDGHRHFNHAVIAASLLEEENRIPEVIIVGIPNNPGTRGRDLARQKQPFLDFIEKEVVTYIGKTYRTAGPRTLFGHSLAGYFTINTLADSPDLFNNYIAASPVLQANQSETYQKFQSLVNDQKHRDNVLYFTLTDEVEEGTPATESLRAFTGLLTSKPPEKLIWHYEYMPGQVHMTTPYLTFFNGLTYVFANYQALRFLNYSQFKDFGGMTALQSYYQRRAKLYGTEEQIPEETLRDLADMLLDDGQSEMALQIYIDLTKDSPESAMVYSGLGEVYKSLQQYQKAIEAHEKAVKLSESLPPAWQRFLKSRLDAVKQSLQ